MGTANDNMLRQESVYLIQLFRRFQLLLFRIVRVIELVSRRLIWTK